MMQSVYIIGQNSEHTPKYEVSYEPHPEDEDIWTEVHKHLYSPSESLDEDRVKAVVEHSRANNLVANYFKTATFKKSTKDLRLESDMVGDVKSF
jgi:hypothetical protein